MYPELITDMPAAEYHARAEISASFLSDVADYSPAHAVWYREHPPTQTPAMRLGTAVHLATLEPERFTSAYVVAGPCEAVLKTGDRKGEACGKGGAFRADGRWYCGVRGHLPAGAMVDQGLNVLPDDDYKAALGMSRAVRAHPAAFRLLDAPGASEVSAFWIDQETGVACKARFDRIAWGLAILDLKSTSGSARPDVFGREIWNRGYFRQAAMYLWAAAAVGKPVDHFAQIAVESDEPHGVSVQHYSADYLNHGRAEVVRLLNIVAECQRTNAWPAYSTAVVPAELPAWADRQIVSTFQEV